MSSELTKGSKTQALLASHRSFFPFRQLSQEGSPPAYHIVLLEDCNELFEPDDAGLQADFYDSLKQEVDAHKGELLLCIHGYNVSFNDAIRGAAQLAYNLKHEEGGYGGAVLAYDWASCGATWRYGFLPDNVDNDLKRAESSANRLADVLEGLAKYVLPGQQVSGEHCTLSSTIKHHCKLGYCHRRPVHLGNAMSRCHHVSRCLYVSRCYFAWPARGLNWANRVPQRRKLACQRDSCGLKQLSEFAASFC
jgi:hypothetical protein